VIVKQNFIYSSDENKKWLNESKFKILDRKKKKTLCESAEDIVAHTQFDCKLVKKINYCISKSYEQNLKK
jgi:hypothetical protein